MKVIGFHKKVVPPKDPGYIVPNLQDKDTLIATAHVTALVKVIELALSGIYSMA